MTKPNYLQDVPGYSVTWNGRRFKNVGDLYTDLDYIAASLPEFRGWEEGDFWEAAENYIEDCTLGYPGCSYIIEELGYYVWEEPYKDVRFPARDALREYIAEHQSFIKEKAADYETTGQSEPAQL